MNEPVDILEEVLLGFFGQMLAHGGQRKYDLNNFVLALIVGVDGLEWSLITLCSFSLAS